MLPYTIGAINPFGIFPNKAVIYLAAIFFNDFRIKVHLLHLRFMHRFVIRFEKLLVDVDFRAYSFKKFLTSNDL